MYKEYTNLLNSLLGLTPKQVLVLSKLFELTESTSISRKFLDRDNRLEIMDSCKIDECNLSTYLTLFKQKGILIKLKDQWILSTSLVPTVYNNTLELTFKINVQE